MDTKLKPPPIPKEWLTPPPIPKKETTPEKIVNVYEKIIDAKASYLKTVANAIIGRRK